MNINFNITGTERKALVNAIAEFTGEKPNYLGMPTAAYQIGNYQVSKTGELSWEEGTDAELLVERLIEMGYEAEVITIEEGEGTGLEIQIPLEDVAEGNLTKLLEAKGALIKKALGISHTRIEIREDCIAFPWFDEVPAPEVVDVYTRFIAALCEMSIKQKRITAKEKEVENEKYAFRCFLLRLGFVGDEYKAARKILLKNLIGSAAFKAGGKKGGEQ